MIRLAAILAICPVIAVAQPSSDTLVRASGRKPVEDLLRAEQPYIAKARATYPGAKKRYLAGLPRGSTFAVRYRLREAGSHRSEGVFIVVAAIKAGHIYGHIANRPVVAPGFRLGQGVSFAESEIEDWTIRHRNGTEEGNFVGKFLERLRRQKS